MSLLARGRQLAADLAGRSYAEITALIAAQADTAADGARLAQAMTEGTVSASDARTQIAVIEHQGDAQRGELVRALSHALTTPIDREDLYRLSRSVDDVLDDLRDFVRETDLYDLEDATGMAGLLEAIADGMQELRTAVLQLVHEPQLVTRSALQARKHGNKVRQLYQLQLAELFRGEVHIEMFKRRELLRRIDVVAIRMGEAADALTDGMLKRSH